MNLSCFLKELKQHADPKRAILDQRYHKSKREHWGIRVPICAELTRTLARELSSLEQLQLAKDLWSTDLFDPMVCAAKMLSCLKPSQVLWQTILDFLKKVDGWALEDHLAHVAWKCVLADLSLLDEIEQWTENRNFWMRRAALVYTLPFAKPGRDPERMMRWAAGYACDPEWFIQKAIGWWLRVLGEHNPDRVIAFLRDHWDQLKGVARKEATRKLSSKVKFCGQDDLNIHRVAPTRT